MSGARRAVHFGQARGRLLRQMNISVSLVDVGQLCVQEINSCPNVAELWGVCENFNASYGALNATCGSSLAQSLTTPLTLTVRSLVGASLANCPRAGGREQCCQDSPLSGHSILT
jgi:hypothetical protein